MRIGFHTIALIAAVFTGLQANYVVYTAASPIATSVRIQTFAFNKKSALLGKLLDPAFTQNTVECVVKVLNVTNNFIINLDPNRKFLVDEPKMYLGQGYFVPVITEITKPIKKEVQLFSVWLEEEKPKTPPPEIQKPANVTGDAAANKTADTTANVNIVYIEDVDPKTFEQIEVPPNVELNELETIAIQKAVKEPAKPPSISIEQSIIAALPQMAPSIKIKNGFKAQLTNLPNRAAPRLTEQIITEIGKYTGLGKCFVWLRPLFGRVIPKTGRRQTIGVSTSTPYLDYGSPNNYIPVISEIGSIFNLFDPKIGGAEFANILLGDSLSDDGKKNITSNVDQGQEQLEPVGESESQVEYVQ